MRIAMLLGAAVIAGSGAARAESKQSTWDFETDALGAPPAGFAFGRTGEGRLGRWVVRADTGAPAGDHVLAQLDEDGTDFRFPVAVAQAPVLKDARVEVQCKQVSGKVDQACGVVLRYADEGNYYLARANALEDNVNLYRVVKGRRSEIQGWQGKVAGNVWHALALEARGDRLRVIWEGKPVI